MRNDLVYGLHVVRRLLALKSEQVLELFVTEDRADQRVVEIVSLATQHHTPMHRVSKKQLDVWLPEQNHQGVAINLCAQALLTEHDLPGLIQYSQTPPLFLVLDGIQDPHNLGACLRTADAAGVTAVIMTKDRSVGITPVVRKVASGAADLVPVVSVTNLARALKQLQTLGVWIMGASLNTDKSLYDVDLTGSVALVLGREGSGLRRLTEEQCDVLLQIPMKGVVESLNVSVATGICLYEAMRQRG